MIQNELLANIPHGLLVLSAVLIGAGLSLFVLGVAKLLTVWWIKYRS